MLDQHERLAAACRRPSPLEPFPKLAAFYAAPALFFIPRLPAAKILPAKDIFQTNLNKQARILRIFELQFNPWPRERHQILLRSRAVF